MSKKLKFLAYILPLIAIALLPVLAHAGLGDPIVPECSKDAISGECVWGFNELMTLINNVIYFVLFGLAIPISAIMFAYAGFLMLTSGGSTESVSRAKHIFTNVALGIVISVAAFLIIQTLLAILGYDGAWIGFK